MPAYCTTSNPPPNSARPDRSSDEPSVEAMVALYANAGASLAGLRRLPCRDSDLPAVAPACAYL